MDLIGNPVTKLKGRYWTSRKTTGTVNFTFRENEQLEEFPTDLSSR